MANKRDDEIKAEGFDQKKPRSGRTSGFTKNKKSSTSSRNGRKQKYSQRESQGTVENAIGTSGQLGVYSATTGSGKTIFPVTAASMQAFGNFTTTPGQENFVEQFNEYDWAYSPSQDHPKFRLSAASIGKRTANVMTIGVTHYFGAFDNKRTGSVVNPITMSALGLKQFIDTSFGTNTNYDPQDLMLYLMAMSAIFPLVAEFKRNLRLVYTFTQNQFPQFVPRGMFTALRIADKDGNYEHGEGADYTAQQLRYLTDRLNMLINLINAFPMPPELKIFGYNDDLFDYIYLDSTDVQTAQMYVFANYETWFYNEDNDTHPSLQLQQLGTQSLETRLQVIENLVARVSALRTNSTSMLQNLFNAYGTKERVIIPRMEYSEIKPIEYVYDEHVLSMIENMVVMDPRYVVLSNVVARADVNDLKAFVYLENVAEHLGLITNLPLQFHKPWNLVTQEDVGWALRARTMLFTYSVFHPVDANHDGTEPVIGMQARGTTGFIIPRSCEIWMLNDEGNVYRADNCRRYDTGVQPTVPWDLVARDFKYAPISALTANDVAHSTDTEKVFTLRAYTANRDVEVTYRMEAMLIYWAYMTQDIWASDFNRYVAGTRSK